MTRFKVALVGLDGRDVPEWVPARFAAEQIDFVVRECHSAEELEASAGDADVVWLFGGSRVITKESIGVLRRCRAIVRTGSGVDNVPVRAATERGILVAHTPQATSEGVSDHVVGLLLAVLRQIPKHDHAVRRGIWSREHGWPLGHLRGQTLGLIGFGTIARLVARKLRGFELTVLAHDPYVAADVFASHGARPTSLDEVLSEADFLSLHCPLTRATYHLIGERELRLMKPTAMLINTARGAVIDEPVLVRALSEGWIAAAGLDVLEQEPPAPDNPLLRLDNVVLTPHVAGYSDEYLDLSWQLSVEAALALAHGHWPRAYVNPEVTQRWGLAPADRAGGSDA